MAGSTCANAGQYIAEMLGMLDRMDDLQIDAITDRLLRAWQEDRLIITLGNGGSAFTASHFVTDLVKTAAVEGQRRLRAMSLTDNTGLLTALGNDIHYDHTFSYQLETFARTGDILIAVSASGNSYNVVNACTWAKAHAVDVVALTGFMGGKIGSLADLHFNVPSENYGVIEDLHLAVGHILCQGLRTRIANRVSAT